MDTHALDPKTARRVVEKISQTMNYEITIVDANGIVVACRQESRVGSVHEAARGMLAGDRELELVCGDEAGVVVRLLCDNRVLGALCIAGEPEDILGMSHVVRLSAETIIEYESFRERVRARGSRRDQFIDALLYRDDVDRERLLAMAGGLGFELGLARAAVVMHCTEAAEAAGGAVLRTVAENPLHGHQDILSATREGDVVVFRRIAGDVRDAVAQFRETVASYCERAADLLARKCGLPSVRFYVGSLQNDVGLYRLSFRHALWLKGAETRRADGKSNALSVHDPIFFVDHLGAYMQSQVPPSVWPPVFEIYAALVSEEEKLRIIELGDALLRSRMNLARCADLLHVHRNTLASHLNRVRQTFGMDPLDVPSGMQFFSLFLQFLKESGRKNRSASSPL